MPRSVPTHQDSLVNPGEPERRGRWAMRPGTILQAALATALYAIGLAPSVVAQVAQPVQSFAPPPLETNRPDVNGDGIPDMLVVVPTLLAEGEARFSIAAHGGSPEDGGELFTIVSPETSDMFGVVTARAGDLDGDGKEDFLVAAPASGDPAAPAGRVYAYSSGDALDPLYEGQAVLWSFAGQPGEMLGWAATPIGDITGDGRMDFAIAAIGSDAGGEGSGRVYVLSGANGAVVYAIDGAGPNRAFGYGLAGLGDVDGDGIPDFVVGAPGVDQSGNPAGAGEATIHSGASGAIIRSCQAPLLITTSPEGEIDDGFGAAIASIGDVTGDGVRDFVVAAPDIDAAFGFSGVDGAPLYTLSGAPGERFGFQVSPRSAANEIAAMVAIVSVLPDADGDGVPESRDWLFRADTGVLLFVEDDEGNAVAPLSADVNADGFVAMDDVAMVVDASAGELTTTGRTDVNGDGVIDDADLAAVVGALGAGGLSAPSASLEECDEHLVDFPEGCDDLSLVDVAVGCDCLVV